jgi:hypothetical protein
MVECTTGKINSGSGNGLRDQDAELCASGLIPVLSFQRSVRDVEQAMSLHSRLFVTCIRKRLLVYEQMAYMTKLRAMQVSPAESLALLARAPDVEPEPEDCLSAADSTDAR